MKHLLLACTLCSLLSAQEIITPEQKATTPKHKNIPKEKSSLPAKPLGGHEEYDFSLSAAYTLWVPYNNITIYDSGYATTAGATGNDLTAKSFAVSGFKVAGALDTKHDKWSLEAKYTWFLHDPSLKTNRTLENVVYGAQGSGASSAESKYYVQFNRVDGTLSKRVFIGNFLDFKPWLGLLGAWDRQSLRYTINLTSPDGTNNSSYSQDWWGIGPYAGARSTYHFNDNLGLFISSGASLLLTNRSTTSYSTTTIPEDPDLSTISNNKDSHEDQEVMVEVCLGAIWESSMDKIGYHLAVSWDMQTYFQHFAQFQFINGASQSYTNYSMQGLTVEGGISF